MILSDDTIGIRSRATTVLIEIAEDDSHPVFDRISAASEVMRDELEHRQLDVAEGAEQRAHDRLEKSEQLVDKLRELATDE